jgi:hypothetical protein
VKEESGSFLKKEGAPARGNQKTSMFRATTVSCGTDRRKCLEIKSFLLLFFKKEVLSFSLPAFSRLPW